MRTFRTLPWLTIINSLFLSIYMLLCVIVEIKAIGAHTAFRVLIVLLSFLPILRGIRIPLIAIFLFFISILFCFLKGVFFLPLVYILSAPVMAKFVMKNKFYMTPLYTVYAIICLIFLNAARHDALDEFMDVSRNYVSIMMLYSSSLIAYIQYRQEKIIVIWPFFVTFLLSLLAVGRSGILCSTLCLLGILIVRVSCISSKGIKIFLLLSIVSIIILSIPFLIDFYEQSEVLERIRSKGFQDMHRENILETYIDNIDITTFFTGYDYTHNRFIHSYGDNPHNSYIRLHSYLGIFFIIPIYLIFYSLAYNIKKREWIYVIPFLSILLRAFTDTFLINHYDFLVLIPIIYSFSFLKIRNECFGRDYYSLMNKYND